MPKYEKYEEEINDSFSDADRIHDDDNVNGYIDFSESHHDNDYYKIKFNEDGESNFWVNPLDDDLQLEMSIYDNDNYDCLFTRLEGTDYGEPVFIKNLPVKAGQYYYIRIGGDSKNNTTRKLPYHLRCKNYPSSSAIKCDIGIRKIKCKYNEVHGDGSGWADLEDGTVLGYIGSNQETRFRVDVHNYADTRSPRYTVVLYDEDGYKIYDDFCRSLDPHEERSSMLYIKVNKLGRQRLKIVVEPSSNYEDKNVHDNIEYRTITFGSVGSGVTAENLGDPSYLTMIRDIEKSQGAQGALTWMFCDLETCNLNGELDEFKESRYFDNFCKKVNGLISQIKLRYKTLPPDDTKVPIYTEEFKKIHYARNLLNKVQKTLKSLINEKENWELLPPDKAAYHMNGSDGEYNLKFVSKNGQHHEAVYDINGKLVTSDENMGTYNFIGPDDLSGHYKYDVETYYELGNTPKFGGRGFTAENIAAMANYNKFKHNNLAKDHFNKYAAQFGLDQVN